VEPHNSWQMASGESFGGGATSGGIRRTQKKPGAEGDEPNATPTPAATIHKSKVKKSESLWLMSFSDLSMILLCFFIILLAMSKPDARKADVVTEAMQVKVPVRQDSLHAITESLLAQIKRLKLEEAVKVRLDVEGLAIEFRDNLLFQSGSARLSMKSDAPVAKVLQVIAAAAGKYHLVIEGHTDDVPLKPGSEFPSNWELSASRGISLLKQFEQRGVGEGHVSIEAFAHTRPKVDIKGLAGPELAAARAANRRVVMRIR